MQNLDTFLLITDTVVDHDVESNLAVCRSRSGTSLYNELAGEKVGRNLEVYAFMESLVPSLGFINFWQEVLLAIEDVSDDAYAEGVKLVKQYGGMCVDVNLRQDWEDLFK
jgi:hypothetical protein